MGRYALVIGINKYRNIGDLTKPSQDAEAIAQLLEQYGNFQEVRRLPEAIDQTSQKSYVAKAIEVTAEQLRIALRQFLMEQAAHGEALIYFSGHGFLVKDELSHTSKGYLAPSDCTIQSNQSREAIGQLNGIDLDSLNALIAESAVSSLVMLMDCCNSGYLIEKNTIQKTLTAFTAKRNYYLIAACRSFETAWEGSKQQPYSLFTQALLTGLAPEKADATGQIGCDDLFKTIEQELRGTGQEPIRVLLGGSIVLARYPTRPSAAPTRPFNRENPYIGLEAFSTDKESYFFGREESVHELVKRLNLGRFLAVIGRSGLGKSSLVKAGLLPKLQRDRLTDSSQWEIAMMTPTDRPCQSLTHALSSHQQSDQPLVLFIDQFEEAFTLCEDESDRQEFIRRMAHLAKTTDRLTRVIVAIRGDFLDNCVLYPDTAELINKTQPTTYVVPPFSAAELEEAIERPALKNGATFDDGLVSQIVANVIDRPGALPLLQYALKELWRVCITEGDPGTSLKLTWEGYGKIGGVSGALNQRATDLYHRYFSPDDRLFIRRLFMELVQFGEEQEATRRRATWEQIQAQADSAEQCRRVVEIRAGQQQRLIITDEKTAEVAHEALLSEWLLLKGWIQEDQESIRLKRQLEADCQEWLEQYQRSDEALLTGARLATLREWQTEKLPKLLPVQSDFLRRSIEKFERDRQEREHQLKVQLDQERQLAAQERQLRQEAEQRTQLEQQKRRLAKRGWVLLAGLLVALVATALIFANGARREAIVSQKGQVETLTQLAETYFKNNQQLEALMTSIQALGRLRETSLPTEEYTKRIQPIVYGVQERNRWEAHSKQVAGLSFNHNITNLFSMEIALASSSQAGSIKLWNTEGGLVKELNKKGSLVWNVVFSHNGKYLASVGEDSQVRLWNLEEQKLEYEFPKYDGTVNNALFSADDNIIFSPTMKGTIILWMVRKEQRNQKIVLMISELFGKTHQGTHGIYGLDVHPQKNLIVYGNTDDNKIRFFDWETKTINIAGAHQKTVSRVKFSSSGTLLATADSDGMLKLWSFEPSSNKTNLLSEIKAHDLPIYSLSFNQDNSQIASSSADKTIKVWNIEKAIDIYSKTRQPVQENNNVSITLKGHTSDVNRVEFAFSNTDRKLEKNSSQLVVSASDDATIRIWETQDFQTFTNSVSLDKLLVDGCSFARSYRKINHVEEIEKACI